MVLADWESLIYMDWRREAGRCCRDSWGKLDGEAVGGEGADWEATCEGHTAEGVVDREGSCSWGRWAVDSSRLFREAVPTAGHDGLCVYLYMSPLPE